MRIGVSLLNLRIGVMGGFETYVQKVVDYLPKCADGDEVVFIVHKDNRMFVPAGLKVCEVAWGQRKTSCWRIAEALLPFFPNPLRKLLSELELDIIFHPHQAMFPLRGSTPSVVTVADIQHLYYPQYFAFVDRLFRRLAYRRAVHVCDKVMAISNYTADCVVEKYGISRDKIKVIHHGFEPSLISQVEPYADISSPYIYYPAASFPHKGHLKLFESFAELKRSKGLPHKLVLSGVRDLYWDGLRKWIDSHEMQEEILDLGYVSYADVLALYSGADAIVFPTEYEGFGLPVLEAAQFGRKIICSKLAVFDEIGVPATYQIDFGDVERLYQRILADEVLPLEKRAISWEESVYKIYLLLKKSAQSGMERDQ